MSQQRTSADEVLRVELTLAVPHHVDGPHRRMQVHEEGHDLGVQVAVDLVQHDLTPVVVHLHEKSHSVK